MQKNLKKNIYICVYIYTYTYTYMYINESLYCTLETNTILSINYTSILKKACSYVHKDLVFEDTNYGVYN